MRRTKEQMDSDVRITKIELAVAEALVDMDEKTTFGEIQVALNNVSLRQSWQLVKAEREEAAEDISVVETSDESVHLWLWSDQNTACDVIMSDVVKLVMLGDYHDQVTCPQCKERL